MQTEDHPFDYGMFEGVIPEGYGAGIVMLWDHGTWEPESEDVDAALRKGDLKFRLNGYKLKGSWVIVKTHGYGGAPNSWLLIKHRDDWAGPINITEFAPLSVKTPNADFAEILSGKTPDLWVEQRARQGRRHRRDVQEDHRTRHGDEGASSEGNHKDTKKKPRRAQSQRNQAAKAGQKRGRNDSEIEPRSGQQSLRQDRPHRIRQALAIVAGDLGSPEIADHRLGAGIEVAERQRVLVLGRVSLERLLLTAAPGWRSRHRPCGRWSC